MAWRYQGSDITSGLQLSGSPSIGPTTGFRKNGVDLGRKYRICEEVNCGPNAFCMTRNFPAGWDPQNQPGWFEECVPF